MRSRNSAWKKTASASAVVEQVDQLIGSVAIVDIDRKHAGLASAVVRFHVFSAIAHVDAEFRVGRESGGCQQTRDPRCTLIEFTPTQVVFTAIRMAGNDSRTLRNGIGNCFKQISKVKIHALGGCDN